MPTPENKVKQKIRRLLDSYETIYYFMPVQIGYGRRTVDFLCCMDGLFFAIEAKAPGEKPTPIQEDIMAEIRRAGGSTFVVSDDTSLGALDNFLYNIKRSKPHDER